MALWPPWFCSVSSYLVGRFNWWVGLSTCADWEHLDAVLPLTLKCTSHVCVCETNCGTFTHCAVFFVMLPGPIDIMTIFILSRKWCTKRFLLQQMRLSKKPFTKNKSKNLWACQHDVTQAFRHHVKRCSFLSTFLVACLIHPNAPISGLCGAYLYLVL